MAGPMGEQPLSWGEIATWSAGTGVDLDPWEMRTIHRLSAAWVAQRHASESLSCPEPRLDTAERRERRASVADKVLSMFRSVAKVEKARS